MIFRLRRCSFVKHNFCSSILCFEALNFQTEVMIEIVVSWIALYAGTSFGSSGDFLPFSPVSEKLERTTSLLQ